MSKNTPVIIYLHGFLSSPKSVKAQATLEYVNETYPDIEMLVPELPNYPAPAKALIESLVEEFQGRELRFIGSSLGGYLSSYLVENFGGKAVLINPAVRPFELLADYLGEQTNPYTNQVFHLEASHMDDLREMNTPQLSNPAAFKVLLQTGDEVLDYHQAVLKYEGADVVVEEGGDHSFIGYERHLPSILDFLLN